MSQKHGATVRGAIIWATTMAVGSPWLFGWEKRRMRAPSTSVLFRRRSPPSGAVPEKILQCLARQPEDGCSPLMCEEFGMLAQFGRDAKRVDQ